MHPPGWIEVFSVNTVPMAHEPPLPTWVALHLGKEHLESVPGDILQDVPKLVRVSRQDLLDQATFVLHVNRVLIPDWPVCLESGFAVVVLLTNPS